MTALSMLSEVPPGALYESARWLPVERCFQWVEIFSGFVYRWHPTSQNVEWRDTGLEMVSLALTWRGKLILAAKHSIYSYSWDGGTLTELVRLNLPENVRFNDGTVGRDGRLYVGTMTEMGIGRIGKLYGFDAAFHYGEVLSDIGISNGIAWLTVDSFAYIDSTHSRIDVVSVASDLGKVDRRVLSELPEVGEPDGLCSVHSDGLYVAMWDGGMLCRVRDGRVGGFDVPFRRPTSVAFSGGPDPIIFVTSAKGGCDETEFDGRVAWCETSKMEFLDLGIEYAV